MSERSTEEKPASAAIFRTAATVSLLLFSSGLCALLYQTAWLRSFRLIFGVSTTASAAVLAIFMGGLGFGGLKLGAYAERHPKPLRLYANLELLIAAGAALSPLLLEVVRKLYFGIGGSSTLGEFGATVVRLILSSLVLGGPVFLMGGTLPAAARAITSNGDIGRKGLALVYGMNTLGSVAGALLGTFVLFEIFGTDLTIWVAALANVAVAMIARALSNRIGDAAPATPRADAPPSEEDAQRTIPAIGLLGAAFITGFSFFLAELVWYRMAGPILGGSTYTFGLVLACALAGIGLGGLAYAMIGPARPTIAHFALSCALEAFALVLPYWLGDEVAVLAWHLRIWGAPSFLTLNLGWAAIAAIMVLPASLIAGYQFPLMFALKGSGAREVASDVGKIYAANTLGAITGSLAGGFGLLPLLSAPGLWLLSAALLLLVAIPLGVRSARFDRLHAAAIAAVVLLAGLAMSAPGPSATWRHSSIGAGRAELSEPTFNRQREMELRPRRTIISERDGMESSLGVSAGDGLAVVVNGKSDGNSIGDAMTFVLSGLLGAALHPNPQSAFVIGLGTGETAGWLGGIPSMKKVDVVELEEGMVEFAALCQAVNYGALENPKVNLSISDGREVLLTTRDSYDLIASEPSNPFRAGIASFFSIDFYRQTSARLAPGGIFMQWIQAYEVDTSAIMLVIATLHQIYPHITIWRLNPGDILLMATHQPQVIDAELIRSRLGVEPYRTALGRIAGVWDVETLVAMQVANDKFADLIAAANGPSFNTDDKNILEYLFARTVGRDDLTLSPDVIFSSARARGMHRPEVKGAVDWDRVARQGPRGWQVANLPFPAAVFGTPPDEAMFWSERVNSRLSRAAELAPRVAAPEHDLFARVAIAEARAYRREDPAQREQLGLELQALARLGLNTDALWIAMIAAHTDRRFEDLARIAAGAFSAARKDPWVGQPLVRRALFALYRGVTDKAAARAIAASALEGPFASYLAERARRSLSLELARIAEDAELCARAHELDEPHPTWNRASLESRLSCYRTARPELVAAAEADLELYLQHEAAPFESRLPAAARTATSTAEAPVR